jgi:hypothetical protein
VTVRIRGGLLGHWSVWTQQAVRVFQACRDAATLPTVSAQMLSLDAAVTDCNSALFDVDHDFHGCIAGCHEILRRQGLLDGIWCLDPQEGLSPGQAQALDRVSRDHPELTDDNFVREHLARWLN